MSKIIFTKEQTEKIINKYTKENLGLQKIGDEYKVSKQVIKRVLIENNIEIKTPKKVVSDEMIGKKFGYVTVIERDYEEQKNQNSNQSYWKCRCVCGNIKTFVRSTLRENSETISCGCKRYIKQQCKNYVGKTIDHLYVEEKINEEERFDKIKYRCKCKCEKEIIVTHKTLGQRISYHSCGCQRNEALASLNRKDISNQTFGLLTAIEPTEKRDNSGSTIWKCICQCGGNKEVSINSLSSGIVKSCGCLKSYGEKIISEILVKNNIPFVREKTFNTCRYNNSISPCKFDFYINNDYIIEFDGKQHFEEIKFFKQSLKEIKDRDNYKNIWCKENNIKIIRIPYWKLNTLTINDLKLETSEFLLKQE